MPKSSEHHWPPPEPPGFVPDGWIPLFEAFKLVGKAHFSDDWRDGEELAAPSDGDLEAAREARAEAERQREERVQKATKAKEMGNFFGYAVRHHPRRAQARRPLAVTPYKGPPGPVFDEAARIAARARGDWVWNQLRQWMFAGAIPAIIVDNQGRPHDVRNTTWARPDAITILHTGQATDDGAVGAVLLSQRHLEAAIEGEQETDKSSIQDEPQDDDASQARKSDQPDLSKETPTRVSLTLRAEEWEKQQRKLMSGDDPEASTYRDAAKIIARKEGLDWVYVERETRGVRARHT